MPENQSIAERQLTRIEQRVQKKKDSGQTIRFTPEAVSRLNKLEAQLRSNATGNKDLQIKFGETQNYFSELNKLTPEDRDSKLKAIRLAAEDEFKDYFQNKRNNLQEDFNVQIDRLNRDFKFADRDTMTSFKNKIAGLDRDTVSAISDAFRSITERGLGSSGAMKALADNIIAQREIAAGQVAQIRDTSLRDLGIKVADRNKDLQTAFNRGNDDINSDQIFNVKKEEQRLQDRQSRLSLQVDDITGQNALSPRIVSPTQTQTTNVNDPISARIASLYQKNDTSNLSVVDLQQRMEERRNNRLNRANLSSNASY